MERNLQFLKQVLTPARLEHSLGVMRVMGELAEIYTLDATQAMTAGSLHDAAKDLSPEQQLALAEEAGVHFFDPCERHPVYLHAPASAYLISRELKIMDTLILDAISAHSYSLDGARSETDFSRCLRAADVLAPSRQWLGMKKLKSVVYSGHIEQAALLQTGWLLEYFGEIGVPIHPVLQKTFQVLSTKLRVTDSFFERW